MENASKAILIAASVLIVILLIAFGMTVFRSTKDSTEPLGDTMDATKIAQFNSKFTSYVGTKSIAQVRALADVVIASNATNTNQVTFNGQSTASNITDNVSSLTGSRFKVTVEYDTSGKLVAGVKAVTTP